MKKFSVKLITLFATLLLLCGCAEQNVLGAQPRRQSDCARRLGGSSYYRPNLSFCGGKSLRKRLKPVCERRL